MPQNVTDMDRLFIGLSPLIIGIPALFLIFFRPKKKLRIVYKRGIYKFNYEVELRVWYGWKYLALFDSFKLAEKFCEEYSKVNFSNKTYQ